MLLYIDSEEQLEQEIATTQGLTSSSTSGHRGSIDEFVTSTASPTSSSSSSDSR